MVYYTHALYEEIIEKIKALKPETLILDDGLFDHYYYIDELVKHCKRLILAIPTELIIEDDILRSRYIDTNKHLKAKSCYDYEYDFFVNGNVYVFMSKSEIEYALQFSNVELAFHSSYHKYIIDPISGFSHPIYDLIHKKRYLYNSFYYTSGFYQIDQKLYPRSFKQYLKDLEEDFILGFSWLEKHFGLKFSIYVPPYNRLSTFQMMFLQRFGISEVYASDRICLETSL